MNTYQRQLLEKLIAELTDKQSPNLHAAQMIAAELKGAMQSTPSENAIPRDRPWHLYPNGTKAPAHGGGHWTRVTGGWKWCTGDVFPSPSGDNMDQVILPQPTPATDDMADIIRDTPPTPDADGWVENTGVMPECAIRAVKLRCGEIRNITNRFDVDWFFSEDDKQGMIKHDKDYDVTHYKPA